MTGGKALFFDALGTEDPLDGRHGNGGEQMTIRDRAPGECSTWGRA
jgi:hypothetical protein